MTIEECEKRNQAVLEAAKQWAKGEEELEPLDFYILCDMFDISAPRALMYCEKSKSPNDARTTKYDNRTLKSLFSFFDRLKTIICA